MLNSPDEQGTANYYYEYKYTFKAPSYGTYTLSFQCKYTYTGSTSQITNSHTLLIGDENLGVVSPTLGTDWQTVTKTFTVNKLEDITLRCYHTTNPGSGYRTYVQTRNVVFKATQITKGVNEKQCLPRKLGSIGELITATLIGRHTDLSRYQELIKEIPNGELQS